jgi:hypothetical protein
VDILSQILYYKTIDVGKVYGLSVLPLHPPHCGTSPKPF